MTLMLLVAFVSSGCQSDSKPTRVEQSAAARALCDREAQTNEPAGARGTLVAAFETTIEAVEPEIRRQYKNRDRVPKLASQPGDEPLALCYYDVPADQQQVQPEIERVGIVVDQQLNSFLLYAGRMTEVPPRATG